METITAELVDNGHKYDAKGRRLITAAERAAFLALYDQSGLTQAAFARREGIKYATFAWWVQNRRRKPGKTKAQPAIRFAQVNIPTKAAASPLEVRFSDGTLLRGSDAKQLASLVQALRG